MSDMIERVERAMGEAADRWAAGTNNLAWECPFEILARAAIEEMRRLPIEIQMAGCEAQIRETIALDGPPKPQDECITPDDWMSRGFQIGLLMKSSKEFMTGWNGAIDAALAIPASLPVGENK